MPYVLDENDNHYIDENGKKIKYNVTYSDTNEYYKYKDGLYINDDGHFDTEDRHLIVKEGIIDTHVVCKKQLDQLDDNIKEYINNKMLSLKTEIIPIGSIIIWAGLVSKIPDGWVLCDGQNGSPDLRSRFIIGAGKGNGLTERILRNTGGAETHKLTIAEMPSHNHEYKIPCGGRSCRYHGPAIQMGSSYANPDKGAIFNIGGGQDHNNMPPFYTLAFIMKASGSISIESNENIPKSEPDLDNMVISNEIKPEIDNLRMNNV